ncbi:MAG: CapA family protein [Candidatus Moraniibacteriota bacterium]|nr:MAG: CapA family protein [Candidatus Moranbacteria bacterium]
MKARLLLASGVLLLVLSGFLFFLFRAKFREQSFMEMKFFPIKNEEISSQEVFGDTDIQSPIRLLFAGDMMFDRYIRTQSDRMGKEAIFDGIRAQLSSADLVVANLEGPITSSESESAGSAIGEARNYVFTFNSKWADVLAHANIHLVNIGNNHILNFGESGLVETRQFLRDAGVKFFGDPTDDSFRSYDAIIRGKRIGFVNYNQFYADAESRALSDIDRLHSAVDILVVYTHWGAEYAPATDEEKRLAHLFVDRGADMIIGSHPHVVQEREVYRGKTIYYSLGNFIFDQYFSSETMRGLLVEASIAPDNSISFREFPLRLSSDGRTSIE